MRTADIDVNSAGLDCTAAHAGVLLNSHILGSRSTMLLRADAALEMPWLPSCAAFTASSLSPFEATASWSVNVRPSANRFSDSAVSFPAASPSTRAA